MLSSTSPSFALSERHHPWLLNSLSFTPAFAAADAPPERKLCNENSSLSMSTAITTSRKSSLGFVYGSGTFFFLSVLYWWFLWLVIDLNMNYSEFSFIFAMWRYLCNVAIGYNSELPLSILLTMYSFTISKMESKIDFIFKSV